MNSSSIGTPSAVLHRKPSPPPPASFPELLEKRWAVAAQRDLFASCRCETLQPRAAFADSMVDAVTWSARGGFLDVGSAAGARTR
ncbi:hypothetical protein PG993_000127 [Apiospora rasikravindrae]|uniref:Uncharacterized protein n=1 Tax=Apiospora rasikravindrae TaxID=990691 RepID=A0ABR1U7L7_9PEZI